MSDDKRKSPRLPLRVEMILKQGSSARPVITDNLSITGAFVSVDPRPEIDERVGVQLRLGDDVAFDSEARVVRHGGGGMPGVGIEFEQGADPRLEQFLRELAPQVVAPGAVGIERRRYPRFPFGAPMTLRHGEHRVETTGIDASLGGLSLCAERLVLKIGELVSLTLASRDRGEALTVDAVVRRTLPSPHPGTFAFGLELTAVTADRLAALGRIYRTWLAAGEAQGVPSVQR